MKSSGNMPERINRAEIENDAATNEVFVSPAEPAQPSEKHRVESINDQQLPCRRSRTWVWAAMFAYSGLGLPQTNAAPEFDVAAAARAGHAALQQGKDEEKLESLVSAKKLFSECLEHDPENAVRNYDLAVAEYALEIHFEGQGNKKSAGEWLASSIAHAQRAVALDPRSADAHALLADLYGMKIGLEGFWAAVHFGSKAEAETKAALSCDPNNPRVQLTLGRRFLYSPKMFGGDVDQAVASFKKAAELDPQSDEAFWWLATALIKKGNNAEAKAAIETASHLNPRSLSIQRLQRSLS
jgi:tetratricopeptide (TPR) repeat protein